MYTRLFTHCWSDWPWWPRNYWGCLWSEKQIAIASRIPFMIPLSTLAKAGIARCILSWESNINLESSTSMLCPRCRPDIILYPAQSRTLRQILAVLIASHRQLLRKFWQSDFAPILFPVQEELHTRSWLSITAESWGTMIGSQQCWVLMKFTKNYTHH